MPGPPPGALKGRRTCSSAEAWRSAGIPTDMVDGVLRPFFAGVLLEQGMTTSRRFTDLMIRMFARGRSTVPGRRHAAAARADRRRRCRTGTMRAGHAPCVRVDSRQVETTDGPVSARAVVVCHRPLDGRRACCLTGWRAPRPAGSPPSTTRRRTSPRQRRILLLDGDESPAGEHHRAVQGRAGVRTAGPRADLDIGGARVGARATWTAPRCARALARLHGTDTSQWELIATYDLPHALPGMPAPHPMRKPVRLSYDGDWVYVAGDHRDTSSLQGALVSGRRAASAVLADLGVRR